MKTRSGLETSADNPHPKSSSSKAKTAKKVRSTLALWMIGSPANLTGCQLPTKRQVLKDFFAFKTANRYNEKPSVIAGLVYDDLAEFWRRSAIPTMPKWIIISRITRLHESYQKLRSLSNRATQTEAEKRHKFEAELDQLFDVAALDAEKLISADRLRSDADKEEDISFLRDQRTERKQKMSSQDRTFKRKVINKLKRERRAKKGCSGRTNDSATQIPAVADVNTSVIETSDDSDHDNRQSDSEYVPPPKRAPPTGTVQLEIPAKVMQSPDVTSLSDRLGISNAAMSALTIAVAKTGGSNSSQLSVSKETCRRARRANREKLAEKSYEYFKRTHSQHGALHWGGKIMNTSGAGSTETLAVLFSDTDRYREGKLLGVPKLNDSTGKSQAEHSAMLLDNWGLRSFVRALVFDTTASNTGRIRGAAARLEQDLNRRVFWLACRHHVAEIVIGDVWRSIFGRTTGPATTDNQKFRDFWPKLDRSQSFRKLPIERETKELRDRAVSEISHLLSEGKGPRSDYRELAQLTLAMLGADDGYRMHSPGAHHHARWMASILFALKRLAWGEQMGYSQETVQQLSAFCEFAALIYVPYWLKIGCAAEAPVDDLDFYRTISEYATIPGRCTTATAAEQALTRHLWYLTQEVVPLALCSDQLPLSVKAEIAERITDTEDHGEVMLGKPAFPTLSNDTSLRDLVGPASCHAFKILGVATDWLKRDPSEWGVDPSYLEFEAFARHIKCVNDPAERAIKLTQDFEGLTRGDERQKQAVLQTVEAHRRDHKSLTKAAMLE